MLEKVHNGSLSFSPHLAELNTYLADFYDWPRSESSSLSSAKSLLSLLEEEVPAFDVEDEVDAFELFENLKKLASCFPFFNKKQINWLYAQYYVYDIRNKVRDIARKQLNEVKRTEFSTFNKADFRQAYDIWQQL